VNVQRDDSKAPSIVTLLSTSTTQFPSWVLIPQGKYSTKSCLDKLSIKHHTLCIPFNYHVNPTTDNSASKGKRPTVHPSQRHILYNSLHLSPSHVQYFT